jgi:hypothetical protein
MSNNPTTPGPGPESTEGELQARFGDRWTIELESTLGVWSAVRKTQAGHHVRVLIARSPAELMAKLETADVVEP